MLRTSSFIFGLIPFVFSPTASMATVKQAFDIKLSQPFYTQADFYQRQQEAVAGYHNQITTERQAEYNRRQNELARLERIRRSQESARNSIPELERKRDYLALGKAWRILEEWDKSLDAANKAIAAYPNVVSGYTLRASLRKRLNDIPGALADYDRAIEIEPNFYGFYQIRGELKKSFDRYGAIQDFRMAMKKVRVDNRYNLIRDSELKILAKELKSLGVAE
jgi:tetratricopeptide (TPR) repeat protein